MPFDDLSSGFPEAFKGDISLPGDPDYNQAIARWAVNAQKKAQIIVFPRDAEAVAQALLYAKREQLPFAVCGGGHSASGASSSEGLVINLSRYFATVRIDEHQKLAYAGGGATWGQVDEAAIKYGLATVGGTVNHTGVGGLTLGGGYGWLTGAHGLTCDNLVSATVVTANGSILQVNESDNQDLFWAIRGGGPNFGVVTEFVFRLHPQRRTIFCGALVFPEKVFEPLMEVTNQFWANSTENAGMFQVFCMAPEGPLVPIVSLFIFFNGSEEEGREHFKAFYNLGPIRDTTKEAPYEYVNTMHNHLVGPGMGRAMKAGVQSKQDLDSLKAALKRITELKSESNAHFPVLIFDYHCLKTVRNVDKDATAYNRSFAGSNFFAAVGWKDDTPDNRTTGRRFAVELARVVMEGQKQHGDDTDVVYGNYDHDDPERPSRSAQVIFGDNYPRLQQIKKTYDPENVFSRWFPIAPA